MGSWGVKALESDNGLDLIFLLKSDYLPKHKKLTLGGLIGFLRRLRSIKNQVPDEDGEREIVELWKESNHWESWDKHLDSLIELLQQE